MCYKKRSLDKGFYCCLTGTLVGTCSARIPNETTYHLHYFLVGAPESFLINRTTVR